ncbi:hypothetical protein R6Q57_007748 [Mikania cordata]
MGISIRFHFGLWHYLFKGPAATLTSSSVASLALSSVAILASPLAAAHASPSSLGSTLGVQPRPACLEIHPNRFHFGSWHYLFKGPAAALASSSAAALALSSVVILASPLVAAHASPSSHGFCFYSQLRFHFGSWHYLFKGPATTLASSSAATLALSSVAILASLLAAAHASPSSRGFCFYSQLRYQFIQKGFVFKRMDVIKSQQLSARSIEKVVVHPLVLLSIVDNYYRVARDSRKRVVGVLLGSSFKGTVDVTNSYAVPFEEDDKDPSIWFLDHNYHEAMFSMFKRINANEHVVGWYSTGPKLRENDLDVHALFNDYIPNPVLVIIDVQPKELGIPTKAYYAIEEVKENATQKSQKVFVHVPSEIAAHEVEEIGVEHLLRDVKDTTISTLATEVTGKLAALKGLDARLKEIRGYLDLVIDGKLPLNHEILYHLQDVFNLLPNLNVADLIKAFAVKTNDQMLVIYLSSLIRSVIALHNLINNKMLNKEHEKAEDAKPSTVPPISGS